MEHRQLARVKGFIDHRDIEIIGKPLLTQNEFSILKERKVIMNKSLLKSKIENSTNGNPLAARKTQLSNPFAARKAQSFNDQSQVNVQKFAYVEAMRDELKQQGILIANLIDEIQSISKVCFENNSLLAITAKNTQSALNAINAMHGKFAVSNAPAISNAPAVINRKGNAPIDISGLLSENLPDNEYQAIYELFKSFFNHKFAKESRCIHLNHFKYFANGINFYSLQSINDTARANWQSYRTENNSMLYAPGSMELAITSLIETGKALELVFNFAPIIDSKAKPESIAAINSKFADATLIDKSSDNQESTIVKDFAYWSKILSVPLEVIKHCVNFEDDINLDTSKELIKGYIIDESNGNDIGNGLNDFIDYLSRTNFANGK